MLTGLLYTTACCSPRMLADKISIHLYCNDPIVKTIGSLQYKCQSVGNYISWHCYYTSSLLRYMPISWHLYQLALVLHEQLIALHADNSQHAVGIHTALHEKQTALHGDIRILLRIIVALVNIIIL